VTQLTPDVQNRFITKIAFGEPHECWPWTGSRHVRAGHGRLVVGGRSGAVQYAHRLAYAHWVGPIPDGLVVRHTCDNPPCVNPGHLLIGTQADNALDMVQRRRHGRERLTPADVRALRGLGPDATYGQNKALGERYGVHPYTISAVRRGRYRRSV
jgi:hypothetical protein